MLKDILAHPRFLLYALLLHVVLLGMLMFSLEWSADKMPTPPKVNVVKAKVVVDDSKRKKEETRKKAEKKRKAEKKKRKEELKRKAEAKKKEEKRKAEVKKKAEEKRKAEAKQKAEQEKKRKAEEEQKRKEEQKRVVEEKRIAEEERVRKEEEAKRRAEEEELLRQQMDEEQRLLEEAEERRILSELDRYKLLIAQKVVRNWKRPQNFKTGMSCTVKVRLATGGHVIDAQVVKSCGDSVLDRSVETAVFTASPLPMPADVVMFERMREINFVFRPEE
jgi:colicin import membrane protein